MTDSVVSDCEDGDAACVEGGASVEVAGERVVPLDSSCRADVFLDVASAKVPPPTDF